VRDKPSTSTPSSSSSSLLRADRDDVDFDDVDFGAKSFNFSSTTAFTAAVIFSIVGGESIFWKDATFAGDFALVGCKRHQIKSMPDQFILYLCID
jgi:hypothetical protein